MSLEEKEEIIKSSLEKWLPSAEKKILLFLDIDGTITGPEESFKNINKEAEKAIENLPDNFIVCYNTGRNENGIEKFSTVLKKSNRFSFVSVYNGAKIFSPTNEMPPIMFLISNKTLREIISEEKIASKLKNAYFDYLDSDLKAKIVSTSDDKFYREILVNESPFKKANLQDCLKIIGEANIFQLVLEFDNDEKAITKIINVLKEKYLVNFYSGKKLKEKEGSGDVLEEDPSKFIIKIRSNMADKKNAVEIICSYYNSTKAICYCNDINDLGMLRLIIGEREKIFGIVTSKADSNVKSFSTHIIEKKESENDVQGVARHLRYLASFYQKKS